MLPKLHAYLFVLLFPVFLPEIASAHNYIYSKADSLLVSTDSINTNPTDSAKLDSTAIKKPKTNNGFNSPLDYASADSMSYSADYKIAYLFGDAKVNYEEIQVTAAYISYDFESNIVFAKAVPDSAGGLTGRPVFKQGSNEFTSDSLEYNFKSQKGITYETNTKEGEGFLIAEKTKKQNDGSFHLEGGKYTTCDAPHPHFYLALSKAIVIPNNKIVSGPAHLVIEDVHLPLFIPFGFFPNKRKSTSGIIIPSYGENVSRGFFLTNGGYYFAINDYVDLKLTGDIYARGTWGLNANTNYYKRYKFRGSFTGSFKEEKTGDEGLDLKKTRYMSINWNHSQDGKANPRQSFSANVNYSSTAYDKSFNYTNRQALITNNKSSSISYNRSWTNMNLSANLRHSQVSSTEMVSFTLPSVNFSVNRFYPFRGESTTGKYKWYENIALSYTASMENNISSKESEMFSKQTMRNAQNGFQHSIPFNVNFKFLKFFTFTPGLNYSGRLYTMEIEKSWADSINYSTGKQVFFEKVDTLHKISYGHGFSPSSSVAFAPTFFGMATFKKGSRIEAIRHVMTPSVSLSMTPELKFMAPDYTRKYLKYDTATKQNVWVSYNRYERSKYGPPPTIPTKSGNISFSLGNTLEMKVRSDKDTVTGVKKVKIIENFNLSSSYNIYAKEFQLSQISFNASAPLFKEIKINLTGSIDPYCLDSAGTRRIDKYYWRENKGIGRLTSLSTGFGYSWQGGKGKKGDSKKGDSVGDDKSADNKIEDKKPSNEPKDDFTYFDAPWSLSFNYSLQYSKPLKKATITQSLSFSGSLSLTPKWQAGFSSGYDFQRKEFAYTSFNITRNLHCWSMSFDFSPFGTYRFYSFRIAAISALLNDLKYDTRKDYYDYNY